MKKLITHEIQNIPMKKILTILTIAGSMFFFSCTDNSEEVFQDSIQVQQTEAGDQVMMAEMDFDDRRPARP